MPQFIIEAVAEFPNEQEARNTQNRIDTHIKSIDGSIINIAINAVENNRQLINECITLAKAGKKTQMLTKLATALATGKLKI